MVSNDMQTPPLREDGLQIEERRDFQRWFWSAQRAAWACFGAFILLAAAGLTGSGGVFDHGIAKFQPGEVDFPRVSRWQAADDFTFVFEGEGETHLLTLDPTFFDRFSIQNVSPHPLRSVMAEEGAQLQFAATGDGPHRVRIDVTPTRPGLARYRVGLDGKIADLSTVVLP